MIETLGSEEEAIAIIQEHLANAGYPHLKAEWHSETAIRENSTIMKVAFKVDVGDEQRRAVLKACRRIYVTSCQKVSYSNSARQYQEGADLSVLVFYAQIHEKE